MYKKLPLIMVAFISGCVTTTGSYSISAYDSQGKPVNEKTQMMAEGSGIYTVRNAICHTYPKATVLIKDIKTGAELKSESPYKCPWCIFNRQHWHAEYVILEQLSQLIYIRSDTKNMMGEDATTKEASATKDATSGRQRSDPGSADA